jgi:hypothetical protein
VALNDKLAQLSTLERAIAEGALTVRYNDKSITYRSLDEMIRIRDMLRRETGQAVSTSRLKAQFTKGL